MSSFWREKILRSISVVFDLLRFRLGVRNPSVAFDSSRTVAGRVPLLHGVNAAERKKLPFFPFVCFFVTLLTIHFSAPFQILIVKVKRSEMDNYYHDQHDMCHLDHGKCCGSRPSPCLDSMRCSVWYELKSIFSVSISSLTDLQFLHHSRFVSFASFPPPIRFAALCRIPIV